MTTALGTDELRELIAALTADALLIDAHGRELAAHARALDLLPEAPPSCVAALHQQAENCAAAGTGLRHAAATLLRHAAALDM